MLALSVNKNAPRGKEIDDDWKHLLGNPTDDKSRSQEFISV